MKICIIHLGDVCDCFVASSIMRGFMRKYSNPQFTWIVQSQEQIELFQYSNNTRAIPISEATSNVEEYDLLVNLAPAVHPSDPIIKAKEISGFNLNENLGEFSEILFGHKKTSMNLFQVYYRLAGMIWRGEGYGINYFPKNKSKKNVVGVSLDHAKLRHYVNDRLNLDGLKLSIVPYKKNIFKRMDEINRCSHLLTDDQLTMHIGIYLRKFVHFLETIPTNTELEFFSRGHLYKVPSKIVK